MLFSIFWFRKVFRKVSEKCSKSEKYFSVLVDFSGAHCAPLGELKDLYMSQGYCKSILVQT